MSTINRVEDYSKLRQALISGLLMLSSQAAARDVSSGQALLHPKAPHASTLFQIAAATSLGVTAPIGRGNGLNLDSAGAWNTEEITVYAKHHIAKPPPEDRGAIALGSIVMSGSNKTDQIGFSGLTVTAALAVPGVPGLDAVANLSGGHDAITPSSTRESAAFTAGLRLKF